MAKIPFDIMYRPQIESSEYRVITRENRPVEIKIWDLKGDFPVVGVYYDEKNNRETAVQVTAEGRCSVTTGEEYCDDFFIITEKTELTMFESAVQEIFYKGREDNIDLLKLTSGILLKVARKEIEKDIPRWKNCMISCGIEETTDFLIKDPDNTYHLSNFVNYKDRYIRLSELEKLPKED